MSYKISLFVRLMLYKLPCEGTNTDITTNTTTTAAAVSDQHHQHTASNANLTYWRSSWSAPPDTPCAWWEHQTSAPGHSSDPPPAETHTHLRFAALSGPLRLVWDRKYAKNLKRVEKSLKIPSEVHPTDQSTSSASISHRVYNKHQRHDAKSKHYCVIYFLCLIIKNLRYILNIIRRLKNMDQYKLLVYLILILL